MATDINKILDNISSVFEKYNTDVIDFSFEAQKNTFCVLLTVRFKIPNALGPLQRNIVINREDVPSELFKVVKEQLGKISLDAANYFIEKYKEEEGEIIQNLKNLKKNIEYIEKETSAFIDKIPAMKKDMTFHLFALKKTEENKYKATLGAEVPGSKLPFYNTLKESFKRKITRAKKIGNEAWEIEWNVPSTELAVCPRCGAISPLEVSICPACGLDFNSEGLLSC